VADQWRYLPGQLEETVAALSRLVCRQIPGWSRTTTRRRVLLGREVTRLVRTFFETSPAALMSSSAPIAVDTYPGVADVPRRLAARRRNLDSADVEADLSVPGRPNRTALDYWWQSVFTMWWKGFW
jgi:hypothetical protein